MQCFFHSRKVTQYVLSWDSVTQRALSVISYLQLPLDNPDVFEGVKWGRKPRNTNCSQHTGLPTSRFQSPPSLNAHIHYDDPRN